MVSLLYIISLTHDTCTINFTYFSAGKINSNHDNGLETSDICMENMTHLTL
jgi:hypothetical protein